MADFRKWLLAFAAAALVLGTGVSANAQNGLNCNAQAANPPLVRAEGVTEQVGDVVLTCTGGKQTPVGTPIPQSNISVTLNANITDRIYNTTTGLSEALLVVDDAYPAKPDPTTTTPATNAALKQLVCPATGTVAACQIIATAIGGSGNPGGDYDGDPIAGHYNVFEGAVTGPNTITFLGVPIDAPGTAGQITLRITNVRANASQLTVGGNFSLAPLQMFVAVNGSQFITLTNPQPIVGYVTPGLVTSVSPVTEEQCLPPLKNFNVTFTENFASSFKARVFGDGAAQNVPGYPYNSESGLWDTAGTIGTIGPLGPTGLADHGTRLLIRFSGFPSGISLSVPSVVVLGIPSCAGPLNGVQTNPPTPIGPLTPCGTGTGNAYYVSTDAYGNSPAGPLVPSGNTSITITLDSTGAGWATYEVLANDFTAVESAVVPVTVGFPSSGAPALGAGSVKLSFAPIPAPGTTGWTMAEPASANGISYPLPRFVDNSTATPGLSLVPCTCNLLFPFITNQAGFDTGLAVSNTTVDPYGTAPQHGPITLNFYGQLAGGTALTPAQATQTTPDVPAGCIYTMTLSGGGSVMNCASGPTTTVPPLAGFQGYLITQAQFQFCHGYAFITDMGAHNLAEGYLALQLDLPGLNRTSQFGENEGH